MSRVSYLERRQTEPREPTGLLERRMRRLMRRVQAAPESGVWHCAGAGGGKSRLLEALLAALTAPLSHDVLLELCPLLKISHPLLQEQHGVLQVRGRSVREAFTALRATTGKSPAVREHLKTFYSRLPAP